MIPAAALAAALTQSGVWVERNPDESPRCAETAPGIYRIAFEGGETVIMDGPSVLRFAITGTETLSDGSIIDVALGNATGGEGQLRFLVEPDGDLVFERGAFDPGTGEGFVFADAGVRADGAPIYTLGFCAYR